jgi:hypothetical protein
MLERAEIDLDLGIERLFRKKDAHPAPNRGNVEFL